MVSPDTSLRPEAFERGLAGRDVVALEADDEGELQPDFLDGFDDALGDHVAVHDATEDVHEDALHVRIAEDDLERGDHLVLRGAAADVEEVGRVAAEVLDDVHRAHREAGAVDEAGDVAVERDVAQRVLRGLDFLRVFLVQVAQRDDFRVAEERVVVERHLRVEGEDFVRSAS
jgi:hypothetical protein